MVRFWTEEQNRRTAVLETSSNEPLFSEQKNRTEEERFLKQAATNHCYLNRRTEQKNSGSWNKQQRTIVLFLNEKRRTALLFFCLFQEPLKEKRCLFQIRCAVARC